MNDINYKQAWQVECRLSAAQACKLGALRDQVVVDTAIIKAHNVEIKRLRDVLDLYGEHLPDCGVISVPEEPVCTCGLVQPPVIQ